MGKLKGLYSPEYPVGTKVRVAPRLILEDFLHTWQYHNKLIPEQIVYAGTTSEVESIGFYHGGDELYKLKGLPGIWYEACLLADDITSMMKLRPDETVLTGGWLVESGEVRGDDTCERIEWLVSHHLQKLAYSPQSGAWETLYRYPDDGRYWERIYPQGHLHGGGPPELKCLTTEEAREKYGAHDATL